MNNITREDISEYLYEEFGLAKKDCNDIVKDIINEIIEGLIKEKVVKIHNFGTFKLKFKTQRIGRNPKTGKEAIISSRNVISFIPSKKLLNSLNKKINE